MKGFPISWSQQMLLFFDQLRPGYLANANFNISGAYRITGPLDGKALANALNALVQVHESLRTLIHCSGGISWQEVLSKVDPVTVTTSDLSMTSSDQRDLAAVQFRSNAEAQRVPFDRAPLLRAHVGRFSRDDYVLCLVMHHAAADALSISIMMRDLATLYGRATGASSVAVYHPQQRYVDIARRQSLMPDVHFARQLEYWTNTLDDLPIASIQLDHRRSSVPTTVTAATSYSVDPSANDVAAMARTMRCSPFMILVAAWSLVLTRRTGVDEILVPTLTLGRPDGGEDVVGFFLNGLFLRIALGDASTGEEIMRRVRSVCLKAFYNQGVPFLRILEEVPDAALLLAEDDFVIMPFQFIPETTTNDAIEFGMATAHPVKSIASAPRRRLSLPIDGLVTTQPVGGEIELTFEYNEALFDDSTIDSLASEYSRCLSALVSHPQESLR